ncbi:MAG: VanZ family protein, partial [Coriobacteriales bacterium]|nr:VanZ family protein [Coriobacteriales bacterium]
LNYVAHFGEYLVLGALLTVLFTGSRFKRWQIVLLAVVLAAAYAASDEIHQLFVPGRSSDPVDVLTDILGASAGALLTALVLKRLSERQQP